MTSSSALASDLPPPVTRPRPLSGKQEAIIEAATVLFTEHGYERTGLDDVARLAGVSKQTIYNNFGDKHGLFQHALAHARSSADTGAEPPKNLLRDPTTLVDDLVHVGRLFLAVQLAPRVAATRRLIIGEVARHPELSQACGSDTALAGPAVVGWFTHRIEVLDAAGHLDAPQPELVARQFFGLIAHDGQQASAHGTRALPDTVATEICLSAAQLIVRAYGTPRTDAEAVPMTDRHERCRQA